MLERDTFQRAEEKLLQHYRLQAQSHYVDLARPKLRARIIETGAGPPVIYIHGGGGFASQWAPLLAETKGFRNLAVDRPGCGLSDPFSYRGVVVREHAVDFLGSLLDALELERAAIVGNSMGGLWALAFALAKPERVSALVLAGCPAIIPRSPVPLPMRMMSVPWLNSALMSLSRPTIESARKRLEVFVGSEGSRQLPEEMIECAALGMQIPGAISAFTTLLERVLSLRGARLDQGISEPEMRRVSQPTLFLWGRRDIFGGADVAEWVASRFSKAELELLDAGHLPWIDEPRRCAVRIGEFLASQESRG